VNLIYTSFEISGAKEKLCENELLSNETSYPSGALIFTSDEVFSASIIIT